MAMAWYYKDITIYKDIFLTGKGRCDYWMVVEVVLEGGAMSGDMEPLRSFPSIPRSTLSPQMRLWREESRHRIFSSLISGAPKHFPIPPMPRTPHTLMFQVYVDYLGQDTNKTIYINMFSDGLQTCLCRYCCIYLLYRLKVKNSKVIDILLLTNQSH